MNGWMSQSVVYYITGHGLGHARRAAGVIRRVREGWAGVKVVIRSSAAAGVFQDVLGAQVVLEHTDADPGAMEYDSLTIDHGGTRGRVEGCLREKARLIETEVSTLPRDTKLIVTDATFLAGEVAERAGVPCVAVTNFTWDWIYEPFIPAGMVAEIQESYRKMAGILKLPFGGRVEMFPRVMQVPHIVNPVRQLRERVLERIGADGRPRVLVGQRGGILPETLLQVASSMPEVCLLAPQEAPAGAPENLRTIRTGPELSFTEVVSVCDVVVSKLGYGTVADCIARGAALLWPARNGFREDEVMEREMTPYLRHRQIGREDFYAGRWREGVMALLEDRRAIERPAVNGDEVCARLLGEWL